MAITRMSAVFLWMVVLVVAVLDHGVTASNFCAQVVEPTGYGCTEYSVQTDDGFVLLLHRIGKIGSVLVAKTSGDPAPSVSKGNNNSMSAPSRSSRSNYTTKPGAGKGSPVLLMHTEFLNGESWFKYVDDERRVKGLLPILLLDQGGFDIWIGHQRATYWGHGHVRLHHTDRAFWDWTWDQHAKYDLPAQLRFISTETTQLVHFIGASQAATAAVAGATDQGTAKMLRSLTLIGSTAYCGNSNSLLLNAWANVFGPIIDSRYYATGFQNGAFNYSSEFPQTGPITGTGATGLALGRISGPNCCLGSTAIDFSNGWDGTTSFKNLLQWQQAIRRNTFSHYDYGSAASNMQAYGRPSSPAYNAAQIPSQLPILVVGGGNDWSAPPEGTNRLVSQLQQPATVVNLTNYAHADLMFSVKRETDIYQPILKFLEGSK